MTISTITVIGAGTMGRGIAAVAAQGAYRTILQDVSPQVLDAATKWIDQSFDEAVSRGKLTAADRDQARARGWRTGCQGPARRSVAARRCRGAGIHVG